MSSSQRPTEVTIASECSAALERGEVGIAKALAKQGLELATVTGSERWIRRFQHLLRVSTGTPIEVARPQGSVCSFCRTLAAMVTAGAMACICDACVARCAAGLLEETAIALVIADDEPCSFCQKQQSGEPLCGAHGYYICRGCIRWCIENR